MRHIIMTLVVALLVSLLVIHVRADEQWKAIIDTGILVFALRSWRPWRALGRR